MCVKPKRNLGCGMSQEACTVAMLCILRVALVVCIALCVATDNYDVMFARVLTSAPVVLSCLSHSQRIKEDKIAQLQTDQRQERCQLRDEFADQSDDRSWRCDAVVLQAQITAGLVRRQMRPRLTPDVCPVPRAIRPLNSPMARPIMRETKKDGGVRSACDYGYLNLVTLF